MEVRQVMHHVLRAGAAPSQRLVTRAAPRWTPRSAHSCLAGSMPIRPISTSYAMLADKPPSRPARPTPFTFGAPSNSSSTAQPKADTSDAPGVPRRWSTPQTPTTTQPKSSIPSDLSPFGDFEDPMELAREIGRETDDWLEKHMPKRPPPPDLRLRPSTGRTIHVQGHVDVARSLQLLQMLVRRNRLQITVSQQRFHERPGLKKKRLRRERWRMRFKEGFKATIKRVKDLSKQGW